MKTTNWKAALAKMVTVGLVAAATVAVPSTAEAQVSFGIRVGGPVYGTPPYRRPIYVAPAPVYVGPEYGYGYAGRDFHRHAWTRHEGWEHRERWGR